MLILILGGSKSGKSAYAENLISDYEKNLKINTENLKKYYLATMEPFSKEAHIAIERHRKMRAGKGFLTIEKYVSVGDVEIEKDSIVLLECVGNVCANEMFSEGYKEEVSEKIVKDIIKLSKKTRLLVVVSNIVFEDGIVYSKETTEYIRNMGKINELLARRADTTVEVVYGIPCKHVI